MLVVNTITTVTTLHDDSYNDTVTEKKIIVPQLSVVVCCEHVKIYVLELVL